ncbi:MAG: inorganic diphosphatase [bacterium]
MNIKNLTIGKNAPEIVNVVVEITKGSQNKYEYDEKEDVIKLDRVLHSPLFYPADYGFIPETRSEDGDHLDALIIATTTFFPGAVIPVRPVAMFNMTDKGEKDKKIIGVVADDPRLNQIKGLKDLNEHFPKEASHFFAEYKRLEEKEVVVEGWEDKDAAMEEIKKSQEKYREEKI